MAEQKYVHYYHYLYLRPQIFWKTLTLAGSIDNVTAKDCNKKWHKIAAFSIDTSADKYTHPRNTATNKQGLVKRSDIVEITKLSTSLLLLL